LINNNVLDKILTYLIEGDTNMDVTLNVQGMTCGHCEKAVKNAVNSVNGVSEVVVHLNDKKVDVVFNDAETNVDAIKSAIEDQGYDVQV